MKLDDLYLFLNQYRSKIELKEPRKIVPIVLMAIGTFISFVISNWTGFIKEYPYFSYFVIAIFPSLLLIYISITTIKIINKSYKEIINRNRMSDFCWDNLIFLYIFKEIGIKDINVKRDIKKDYIDLLNEINDKIERIRSIQFTYNDFALYISVFYNCFSNQLDDEFYNKLAIYSVEKNIGCNCIHIFDDKIDVDLMAIKSILNSKIVLLEQKWIKMS